MSLSSVLMSHKTSFIKSVTFSNLFITGSTHMWHPNDFLIQLMNLTKKPSATFEPQVTAKHASGEESNIWQSTPLKPTAYTNHNCCNSTACSPINIPFENDKNINNSSNNQSIKYSNDYGAICDSGSSPGHGRSITRSEKYFIAFGYDVITLTSSFLDRLMKFSHNKELDVQKTAFQRAYSSIRSSLRKKKRPLNESWVAVHQLGRPPLRSSLNNQGLVQFEYLSGVDNSGFKWQD